MEKSVAVAHGAGYFHCLSRALWHNQNPLFQYTFCSVLALNFYMTTSSRQSETNSLKICITQLQTSGEAKSWNQNKAQHVNPAVLVIQNKVKMQMSFEHTMFLFLGPQFILYFSFSCGNILKKAGHSILRTHCLAKDLEVKGISVCSWPENLWPYFFFQKRVS